ncbi:MAG: phosphatidate cytidylyltransferase [Legionella sp.]|nr:MAG: phosphatidate cytidylyltransferase [Legionella sp.]
MFKQRFFTAVLLIPLVLFCIYYANDAALMGVLAVLTGAMAWEWTSLIPLQHVGLRVTFLIMLAMVIWGLQWIFSESWMLCLISVLWIQIAVALWTYPRSSSYWGRPWLVAVLAWFLLALFAKSLWALFHQIQGRDLLVYALCLVWATDIGAYLVGKCWGKHRLIPNVSPGKTVEGMLGGLLCALLIAALGAWYFHPTSLVFWFVKAGAVIIVAMLGDLWMSMLKRRCKVKDTGRILPGHGGILDRLDSLLAVLPFFYYFYQSY